MVALRRRNFQSHSTMPTSEIHLSTINKSSRNIQLRSYCPFASTINQLSKESKNFPNFVFENPNWLTCAVLNKRLCIVFIELFFNSKSMQILENRTTAREEALHKLCINQEKPRISAKRESGKNKGSIFLLTQGSHALKKRLTHI